MNDDVIDYLMWHKKLDEVSNEYEEWLDEIGGDDDSRQDI
jgi:hypothetical protein